MAPRHDPWSLVVPIKRLDVAKSRIDLDPVDRADLAMAMATDTVAAAIGCPLVGHVVVVTDDPRAVEALAGSGATIVADTPEAGLNPALRHGAAAAGGGPVAALGADLPALTPADLNRVLLAAGAVVRGVVADTTGAGTTILTAASFAEFEPRFGPASFAAHRQDGSADLTAAAAPSVRRDVDTLDGLRAVLDLGVGAATRVVVARLAGHLG
jgi:2-phospho-L-lactate guanylyltransferase